MPKCRSPNSRQTSLDELAALLASGTLDGARFQAGYETLRRRLRTGLGIPYFETEDPAMTGIASFLAEVQKDPGNEAIATGAYLWTVTKNRHFDGLRKLKAKPATESLEAMDDHQQDRTVLDSCRSAYEDRQGALSLQLHAISVLDRHARHSKDLLGGQLEAVLRDVHLAASSSDSVDSALHLAAAMSCERGVLGGQKTRNLRVRLGRQPELRRELSMPARPAKPAKPGSSTDE